MTVDSSGAAAAAFSKRLSIDCLTGVLGTGFVVCSSLSISTLTVLRRASGPISSARSSMSERREVHWRSDRFDKW
ncbi:MAG: hypothetical protein MZV49_07215 [Rhodopseudomonas palustris]|nr:hypothetical protein [Rhodopseudomonas palustris]